MLTLEDLKESSGYQMLFEMAVKEGREEGLQKGQQEGRQEGRQEEARQLVRRVIALRFPELGSLPELDAITDASRLEALHDEAVLAKDASQVLAAIRRS